jgi:8-oxo-dGTP pyrophosphatase MutT (NUDIX family)
VTSTWLDPASWYASLATLYGTAASLITSPAGDVLLVKPNYRDYWQLPGGVLEENEAPETGCAREVREEIGLDLPVGDLLALHWIAPSGERPKAMLAFVFDGGVLRDTSEIVLQESELDGCRFVAPGALDDYVPPHMAPRIVNALRARETGATVYLST